MANKTKKMKIEGIADYQYNKCSGEEFYEIGEQSNIDYGRSLDINNFPSEFFDFIKKQNGKKIRLTLELEVIE